MDTRLMEWQACVEFPSQRTIQQCSQTFKVTGSLKYTKVHRIVSSEANAKHVIPS